MTEPLSYGATPFILGLLLTMTALSIVMSVLAITYKNRSARLPDATRFEDVRERRQLAELKLEELREKIRDLDRAMTEKDQKIAEIVGLEDRIETLRAEYDGLANARGEIDEVRADAAVAAEEYALAKQGLDEILDAAAEKQALIDRADGRIHKLEDAARTKEIEIDGLRAEGQSIEADLAPLRAEREAAHKMIEEARHSASRLAALEQSLLDGRAALTRVEAEIAPLESVVEEHRAAVAAARERHLDLTEAVTRLEALKARLEKETGVPVSGGQIEADVLGELELQPSCISSPAQLLDHRPSEQDGLANVSNYLRDLGLNYSERTLKGFHTALKINDKSQMTVLAGVSGTGKSLLPRRYCEAMGIHFLQIAVEPRWDSPQDLLGFYNYIEKRYRATDLARLLVHMDPYDTSELVARLDEEKPARHEHMALVLLDEMNLARVEYYFSEFLSRLEARPSFEMVADKPRRKDAEIPIDIRGLGRDLKVFPSHNLLFAGTMNDDESTQALSDKVLDRGNVLQFAAPETFDHPAAKRAVPAVKAQKFSEWRSWIRDEGKMEATDRSTCDSVINQLAQIMNSVNRPFGHRLRDGMFAYCANYPRPERGGVDIRHPLADQIEYRIMPKLRGVDIDSCRSTLDDLVSLVRTKLDDGEFAERLESTLEEQATGSGLFVWRGLTRTH
ncbi:hypothetical protein [Maricaulis sp.]|uniref:hypothetical protein n=1 Tax=Maricaulis sp. TaxID=1486257 RepID=UPI003A8D226C